MESKSTTYQFDIIRGIMCFMIFNRHFLNLFENMLSPNSMYKFIADSQVALFYFFVLSGMVCSLSFQKQAVMPKISHFAMKRVLRLLPVVIIAIALGYTICSTGLLYFKQLMTIQTMSPWALSLYNFNNSLILAVKDIFFTMFCGFSYYDANFWTISYELYIPILLLIMFRYIYTFRLEKVTLVLIVISVLLLGVQMNSLYLNSVYILCFFIGSGLALYSNKINISTKKIYILFVFSLILCFFAPHFFHFRIGNPLRLIGVIILLFTTYKSDFPIIKVLAKNTLINKLGGGKL